MDEPLINLTLKHPVAGVKKRQLKWEQITPAKSDNKPQHEGSDFRTQQAS